LSAWSYASTAVAEVIDNQFMGTASISADYGANGLLRIMDNTMVGIPYGTAISAYGGPAVIMNNHVARYVTGVDVGNDVEIAYNIIEGCGTGIIGFGMGVFVHHNRILNCTERGIWAYRNTAGPIDDNEIRGCGSEGIRCEYGAPYARRNTIANNGGSGIETQGGYIEDNIIAWNGGDGLRIGGGVVIQPAYPGTISGNTIVRNGGDGLFLGATSNNSTDHNLVAFNDGYGIRCVNDYFPVSISCNDSYGNGDAPFGGVCADALGEDGNVSVDPLFCGGMLPDEAPGDFLLRSDSPCAPGNSECGLIGALPVGCAIEPPGKAATTHSTWGRIKARFR
jgi:parallel beta-helix repeat protein